MNELQQVINFTDADLKANAEGFLSLAQRNKLEERQKRSLRLLSGVAGVVLVMALLALVTGNAGMIVFGVMALISAVMLAVEYVVGYYTYTRDLNSDAIETIQGVVSYVWRGDAAMGIETKPSGIRIGDVQFLLMEDQARAFADGEIYVLHYAPATHTLLSAERVYLREQQDFIDAEVAYYEDSSQQITDSRS